MANIKGRAVALHTCMHVATPGEERTSENECIAVWGGVPAQFSAPPG